MKILMLATSYPRTKDDYWVPFTHSFAKEMAKHKDIDNFTVVTSHAADTPDHECRDKVNIYRFSYFWPRSLQKLTYTGGMRESFKNSTLAKLQAPLFLLFFMLKSLRYAKKADIINAHWILSGLAAIPLRWLYKKPIIITVHGGGLRSLPRWLSRYVLTKADHIITAHQDIYDEIKSYGYNNISLIRNLLDYDKYNKTNLKPEKIKKEFKIKDEFIVTFVGRLEEMKDPITFVRAIPKILQQNKKVKFFIIGDGHLTKQIRQEIKHLNIENHVILTGGRYDVQDFLALTDIFVATSNVENCFSTTILEALYLKVPCILTKAGMTERFFTHKKYAYLVPIKNNQALAKGILELTKNKRLRDTLSKNSTQFLDKNEFTKKAAIEKTIRLYKQFI